MNSSRAKLYTNTPIALLLGEPLIRDDYYHFNRNCPWTVLAVFDKNEAKECTMELINPELLRLVPGESIEAMFSKNPGRPGRDRVFCALGLQYKPPQRRSGYKATWRTDQIRRCIPGINNDRG